MDNNENSTQSENSKPAGPRRLSWQSAMSLVACLMLGIGAAGGWWLLAAAEGNLELARYGYGFMAMTGLVTLLPAASAIRGRKGWKIVATILFVVGLGLACYGLYGLALAGAFGMNIRDSI